MMERSYRVRERPDLRSVAKINPLSANFSAAPHCRGELKKHQGEAHFSALGLILTALHQSQQSNRYIV
jgi:hypothetical protein